MIESITCSFCLRHYVQNGLSYSGQGNLTQAVFKETPSSRVSYLLEQINISCYTEYKASGPSLIYNYVITCFGFLSLWSAFYNPAANYLFPSTYSDGTAVLATDPNYENVPDPLASEAYNNIAR